MKRTIGGIVHAGVMATGLAACGGGSPSTDTLHIQLQLFDGTTGNAADGTPALVPGQPCYGGPADSDISSGANATVKDASGTIIGTTTLGNGTAGGGVCVNDDPKRQHLTTRTR